MKYFFIAAFMVIFVSCNNESQSQKMEYKKTGVIERSDPGLDNLIDEGSQAEILAEGFNWSEGPLWLESQHMLIFSDVPENTVFKWTEEKGKEVYLKPSGYTGSEPSTNKEPGSNGLTLDDQGRLVLCQHGDRRVARMDAPLDKPASRFIALAESFEGKRFSSPNDCVFNSAGELFFTDPPYGLGTQNDQDPKKELAFNGVYKVKKNGEVILLNDSITRPNGIAFLPGEKQLIVACSDPAKPNWYIYDVQGDSLTNGRIFFSLKGYDRSWKGLPDGFKVTKNGTVIASGPGGVYFFNREGKKLGMLRLDNATSNIALSPDEKTVYITNDMYLLRLGIK